MSVGVWAVLAVLVLTNALYVAAEFGAVGVRRSRVRRMSEDGSRLARRLLPHIDQPAALDQYVGASQVGITVSSLMLGAYAQATITLAFAPWLGGWFQLPAPRALSVAAVVVLGVLTAVQLVLGELVPKAIALQYPTETALATVLPLQWSLAAFRPVITVLNGAAILLLRVVGVRARTHRHLHSPEEIDLLIAESRDGGLLEPQEQQRLRRALHLGMRTARDLMVPRERVTMLNAAAPWEEVLRTVSASPFSRLPVYRDDPAHVVGHVRVKDLLERYLMEGPLPVDRLMRPILQLPPSLAADRVLALFRDRRAHAAVVVEENGQALGLITIQDVIGELFGLRRTSAEAAAAAPPGWTPA
jgi:putative hemolysin